MFSTEEARRKQADAARRGPSYRRRSTITREHTAVVIGKQTTRLVAEEGLKFLKALFNGIEGEYVRDLSQDRLALFQRLSKRVAPLKRMADLLNLRVADALLWLSKESQRQHERTRAVNAKIIKTAALNHRTDGEMSLPAVVYSDNGDPDVIAHLDDASTRVGGEEFVPLIEERAHSDRETIEGFDVSEMVDSDVKALSGSVFTSGMSSCVYGTRTDITDALYQAGSTTGGNYLSAEAETPGSWFGSIEVEQDATGRFFLPRLNEAGVPAYEIGLRGVAPHDERYPINMGLKWKLPRMDQMSWRGRYVTPSLRSIMLIQEWEVDGVPRFFLRTVHRPDPASAGSSLAYVLSPTDDFVREGFFYGQSTVLGSGDTYSVSTDSVVKLVRFYAGSIDTTGDGSSQGVAGVVSGVSFAGVIKCVDASRMSGRVDGRYIDVDATTPMIHHLGRYDYPLPDSIHDLMVSTHLEKKMVPFAKTFGHVSTAVDRHMRKVRSASVGSSLIGVGSFITDHERRPFIVLLAETVLGLSPAKANLILDTASWFRSAGAFGGVDRVGLEGRFRTFLQFVKDAYQTIPSVDLIRHD